ncbi:MAG: ribonuclease R, partial [Pseudotabrizicola sp.]|nr:ribonuclease R [Pseudotabrizicola sp.]
MEQLPSKEQILQWITENPGLQAKRDIAKAFGIKGAARIELKRILAELEDEGHVAKKGRSYRDPESLPPVSILVITGPDAQGDVFARPMEWDGEGEAPRVLFIAKKGDPALAAGDRILARLSPVDVGEYQYEARLIRHIGTNPLRVLGVFRANAEGGRIVPIDKGQDKEWRVGRDMTLGAKDGELVEGEAIGRRNMGLPQARVTAVLGDPSGPRAVSLIAIHQHGIPDQFPDAVIAEADRAEPAVLAGREDLRDLP